MVAKAVAYKGNQPYGAQQTPFKDVKISFPKTFVSAVASSAGATTTLYSVPADKIFILLGFFISGVADNGSGGGDLEITTTDPNMATLIRIRTKASPAVGEVFNPMGSISLAEGIRFASGTRFDIYNGSSMEMSGTLIGYLIDKNAESLFYLT
jgi:hypothetical protein